MTDTSHNVHAHTGPPRPADGGVSAATRHMSAGAYLDEEFARRSLDEVYHQPQRAVAPSYGFDLGTVLAHCQRGYRIALARDAAIVGVLFLTMCVAGAGLVVGLAFLAGWHGLVSTYRLLAETFRRIGQGEQLPLGKIVRQSVSSFVGVIVATIAILISLPLVGVGLLSAAGVSGSADFGSVLALLGLGTVLTMLVAFGAPAVAALVRWGYAIRNAPGGRPDTPAPDARIAAIRQHQLGNTTVYSGYSPFIGSGVPLSTEGFAMRLIAAQQGVHDQTGEGAREYTRLPFTNQELVRHVGTQLNALALATDPEHRLAGLRVTDRIFAAGNEALWTEVWTDQETIGRIIREPADISRHYLTCQVESWNGELVTSVYVHLVLIGRSLYTEIATYALAPCWDEYRVVDDVRSLGAAPYLRAVWSGLTAAPGIVAAAPVNLIRAGAQAIARRSAAAQTRRLPRGYDYGARTSVRELASPELLRNDFQTQDVAKYKNVITRRVIAATIDFLEARGVDVTEFRQRGNVLINSGVYVGGSVGANAFNQSLNNAFNAGGKK